MSTIIASNISDGTTSVPSATVVNGSAKAWVNFNGTGTVAIRRALNVSSITDNGTGNYTVNFTAAMVDANYAFSVNRQYDSGQGGMPIATKFENPGTITTNTFQVALQSGTSNVAADSVFVSVAIFS